MIAWLRSVLRRWLLEAPDDLCFKPFVYGTLNGVDVMGSCRKRAGHRGACDIV